MADGYWLETEAPPIEDADYGPVLFELETGALPLQFKYYLPKGRSEGVVVRLGDHGRHFDDLRSRLFLNAAREWADVHVEGEAYLAHIKKYHPDVFKALSCI